MTAHVTCGASGGKGNTRKVSSVPCSSSVCSKGRWIKMGYKIIFKGDWNTHWGQECQPCFNLILCSTLYTGRDSGPLGLFQYIPQLINGLAVTCIFNIHWLINSLHKKNFYYWKYKYIYLVSLCHAHCTQLGSAEQSANKHWFVWGSYAMCGRSTGILLSSLTVHLV